MGRNIDFTKEISEDDEKWLRERSRGWQVDENKRVIADAKRKSEGGETPEEEWAPTNTVAEPPFDEAGPSPRQVPRPVGERTELDSPDADLEGGDGAGEEPIEELTVEQLKEELHARGLPVSGNKDELVKRLRESEEGD
jgi:hypothetical protein